MTSAEARPIPGPACRAQAGKIAVARAKRKTPRGIWYNRWAKYRIAVPAARRAERPTGSTRSHQAIIESAQRLIWTSQADDHRQHGAQDALDGRGAPFDAELDTQVAAAHSPPLQSHLKQAGHQHGQGDDNDVLPRPARNHQPGTERRDDQHHVGQDGHGGRQGEASEDVLNPAQDGHRADHDHERQHDAGQCQRQGGIGIVAVSPIQDQHDHFRDRTEAREHHQQQADQSAGDHRHGRRAFVMQSLGQYGNARRRDRSLAEQHAKQVGDLEAQCESRLHRAYAKDEAEGHIPHQAQSAGGEGQDADEPGCTQDGERHGR